MDTRSYPELVQKLEIIQSRLQSNLPAHTRIFDATGLQNRRASLLIGPRGVGKTTFLLSFLKPIKAKSIYFSLDNPLLADVNLYALGDWLFQNGYENLFLDEVHNSQDWSLHLKGLYDANPDKKIIATDSSSLVVRKGLGDLSRRFVIEKFPYLSFKEFLYLKFHVNLPKIGFTDFLNLKSMEEWFCQVHSQCKKRKINIPDEFKKYLAEGIRPFFVEGSYSERLTQTIEKIIHQDIPYFLPEVKERHLHLMTNVISLLLTSQIPTLNIESLSKRWAISKPTVYNLLHVLESSYLINIIKKKGAVNGKTKGSKIFLSDPSSYSALHGLIGNQREAFFCMQVQNINRIPYAANNDEDADFVVDGIKFEIGGAHKKTKNADFALRDNYDNFHDKVRPLWAFGFTDPS